MRQSRIAIARQRRLEHWMHRARAVHRQRSEGEQEPPLKLVERLYEWTVILDWARGQLFEGQGVDDLIADLRQAFLLLAATEQPVTVDAVDPHGGSETDRPRATDSSLPQIPSSSSETKT